MEIFQLDYKKIDTHILQNDGIDHCYCVSDDVFLDLIKDFLIFYIQ